jgi:pyridoxal phosphate enzyme (YggS family)
MSTLADNLLTVGATIKKHADCYQRKTDSIQLLAVSKRHTAEKIEEAFALGQKSFGENYVQELIEKAQQLSHLDIEWHFIGPLQSNKTKPIAETVDWVHTIDRLKIAERLSRQRPKALAPINVCIQDNISNEASKSGVLADDVQTHASEIIKLPQLKLRGLMAIPAPHTDFNKQRAEFSKLALLKQTLNKKGFKLDTLSMGMSGDSEAAIAEGATIIRIGTSIFGRRSDGKLK